MNDKPTHPDGGNRPSDELDLIASGAIDDDPTALEQLDGLDPTTRGEVEHRMAQLRPAVDLLRGGVDGPDATVRDRQISAALDAATQDDGDHARFAEPAVASRSARRPDRSRTMRLALVAAAVAAVALGVWATLHRQTGQSSRFQAVASAINGGSHSQIAGAAASGGATTTSTVVLPNGKTAASAGPTYGSSLTPLGTASSPSALASLARQQLSKMLSLQASGTAASPSSTIVNGGLRAACGSTTKSLPGSPQILELLAPAIYRGQSVEVFVYRDPTASTGRRMVAYVPSSCQVLVDLAL
jgi:hypothetical protein